MIDAIFSGPPSNVPSPAGATVAIGIDTSVAALYASVGNGWVPVTGSTGKNSALAQTGATASVLTYTAPVSGLYRVDGLVEQATSTNGTPGAVQVAYTNATSGSAVAAASITTPAATTGIGQAQSGSLIVNAKAGTSIVVSALAPTTLTQNVYGCVEFLG